MKSRKSSRLGVESLERRELMAGLIALNPGTGVLTIVGSNAADTVVVSQVGGAVQVSMSHLGHNHVQAFPAPLVQSINFSGLAGNDYFRNDTNIRSTANGGSGNDMLIGGWNNDLLIGGLGDDVLLGRTGNDIMHGQDGNDRMYGGIGNDCLYGGNGNDYIRGEAGNDYIRGGLGNDDLFGDDGVDRLFGEGGADDLIGGNGNDYLDGGYDGAVDRLWGQLGADTFVQHRVWNGFAWVPEDAIMDFSAIQGDVVNNVFHP
jgi:Ca2+-binding RTX toxin-like protein